MEKHRFRTLVLILRNTKADRVLLTYTVFVFINAALIMATEPTIRTYQEALWYSYAVISTAGFGDVVVTGLLPKILSLILTIYSALVIAIVTGVVVNYYNHMIELRNKETINAVMDQLERLPELSREELEDLSKRVQRFRNTGVIREADRNR